MDQSKRKTENTSFPGFMRNLDDRKASEESVNDNHY